MYVYKIEFEGRVEPKQVQTIFIQVPHSMRTKHTRPGGIVRTDTCTEVTGKCNNAVAPRPGGLS